MKVLLTRVLASQICDLVEDMLEEENISIPVKDYEKEDYDNLPDEEKSRLYGEKYFDLEDKIHNIIVRSLETAIGTQPIEAINGTVIDDGKESIGNLSFRIDYDNLHY